VSGPQPKISRGSENSRAQNIAAIAALLFVLSACGSDPGTLNLQLVDAVKRGDLAETQRLLDAGAQVDARDAKHGSPAVVWAAHEGHVELLEVLLNAGGSVESAKGEGDTALWYAAQQGHLGTARLLLDHGAEPNPTGPDGASAVAIAEKNGFADVVELLRARGGH
jgi:ankyrin repeat protein